MERHPDVVLNRALWPILDTEDLLAAVHRMIAALRERIGPLDLRRVEVDLDYARWALAERGIDTYDLW